MAPRTFEPGSAQPRPRRCRSLEVRLGDGELTVDLVECGLLSARSDLPPRAIAVSATARTSSIATCAWISHERRWAPGPSWRWRHDVAGQPLLLGWWTVIDPGRVADSRSSLLTVMIPPALIHPVGATGDLSTQRSRVSRKYVGVCCETPSGSGLLGREALRVLECAAYPAAQVILLPHTLPDRRRASPS